MLLRVGWTKLSPGEVACETSHDASGVRWKVGREAYRAILERWWSVTAPTGSNPVSSAWHMNWQSQVDCTTHGGVAGG